MKLFQSSIVKTIIMIIALLNIVVMMVYEYGLPSPAAAAEKNTNVAAHKESTQTENVGTIEAVEKEEANKETEAAETALAKKEKNEDEEPEEEIDPEAPILELTDDHIYLKVGDRFNYMSYIEVMEDIDGSDLSHYIYLDKDVDTSQPGEVELTYRITSTITGKSTSKVLLITIEY